MSRLSYRAAIALYVLFFALLTSAYWGKGEVVAPTRQFSVLGSVDTTGATQRENAKFNDFENGYIPEIWAHMHGARSGWLALWTNESELGRPLYQISGFSGAYLPSWIIARLVPDPWRFITVLSLLTCFGTGIFFILFCREARLSALGGLVAGTSLAASPLLMYWLTFPMFPAVWCWATGALWAVTRLSRKPDLLGWSALAFSGYSLLMTAYPQPVVFHAYILGGYGLYLGYRAFRIDPGTAARFLALSAGALLAGAIAALPVYIDLMHISEKSARLAPDPSFFTAVLPRLDSLAAALRLFVLSTAPELLGAPMSRDYPYSYDGLSITPLAIFLVVLGLATWRKTWGWWLAVCVLCLLAFVHPLYALGVRYLGFNLSRSSPLGSILLPLGVIMAYGVGMLEGRERPRECARWVWVGVAVVLSVIVIGTAFGLAHGNGVRWGMVLSELAMALLFAAHARQIRPVLLVVGLCLVLATISRPLMLRQAPSRIAKTSPLVEKVRSALPPDARFAVASPGLRVLPPNLNAELGLPSIHSYNSLSSIRYHSLIKALGGKMLTYGRWNGAISPNYDGPIFWMSNVGVMLSPKELHDPNLKTLGVQSGVFLYGVVSRMGRALQVVLPHSSVGGEVHIADPRQLPSHIPVVLADQGDMLEFEVAPERQSLLVLSQKYHADWRAQALTPSGWAPARTVAVDGVFQGVSLADGTHRVRLEFRPYARYAWIAHVLWLSLGGSLGFVGWRRWRLARREVAG